MKFGMLIGDVPREVDPLEQLDGILRQVEAGQRNGLSHFVIGHHFLYGDLRWLQPIPLLARLAGEIDEHVRLGMSVLLAPLYNPIVLAEELTTLDIVTRGRLDVGVGLGYRSAEFDMLNIPFKYRVSRLEECLDIMKLCWAMEDFDYRGKHWQITGATPHIACVQQPHPPIWIGAHSRAGARRAGRVGDNFVIPPEYDIAEMRVRLGIMAAGIRRAGQDHGPSAVAAQHVRGCHHGRGHRQLRRREQESAISPTYATSSTSSTRPISSNNYYETVKESVAVGTAQEVIDHFTRVARELPVDPIIIKPQWPRMHIDEVIDAIETMGREVIPALAEVDPIPFEDIEASLVPVADEVAAELARLG